MATKKKPSVQEQELRYKYSLRHRVVDHVGTILNTSTKFGFLALVFYFIRGGLIALSGQTTIANLGLTVASDLTVVDTVEAIVMSTAVIYGLWERKQRHSKTKYFANRLSQLERSIDPRRSSSKLMPSGT